MKFTQKELFCSLVGLTGAEYVIFRKNMRIKNNKAIADLINVKRRDFYAVYLILLEYYKMNNAIVQRFVLGIRELKYSILGEAMFCGNIKFARTVYRAFGVYPGENYYKIIRLCIKKKFTKYGHSCL